MDVDQLSRLPPFGDLLRRHRLAAGLTQEELAERAGLSRRGISDLERGARTHPYRETLTLLVDALGLSGGERSTLLTAARRPIGRAAPRAGRLPSLPVPLTPFIGRRGEQSAVGRLLRNDAVRFVTLTGAGGVGKTRLALAVAEQVADAFPDGQAFVDLAPLRDPTLVLPEVAATLGLREAAGRAPAEVVSAYLRGRRLLLLLDNFEHLLAAAPVVTDLLAAGPHVKILATSRAPLHVRGEHEYPVSPLCLPGKEDVRDLTGLAATEAVAFFIDPAQAVRPVFALTTGNAAAHAEICARLDGLPLALELAAARVKSLPPAILLPRLDARLPLLIGGSRDAPGRQRTLRAALAWSHDLLAPDEQTLFRRVGVFVGGCTLEAAEAVAGVGGEFDVLPGLDALADQSLIRLDESGPEPRYRMLETIREFALENLENSGEGETIRERQAAWCLALAEAAETDLNSGRQHQSWIRRLDIELPNIRAAITWLLGHGQAASVLRLCAATHEYWIERHNYAEIRSWLQEALDSAPDAPAADRAMAPDLQSVAAISLGDLDAAAIYAQQAVEEAAKSGDPLLLGLAQVTYAFVLEQRGDVRASIPFWEEALRHLRAAGNSYFTAAVQLELGDRLVWCGELALGVTMLDEALATLRQGGDNWPLTSGLGKRAYAALVQGELANAACLFDESLIAALAAGTERSVLGAAVGLAGVALARGEGKRAGRLLGAVDASRERAGVGRVASSLHAEQIEAAIKDSLGEATFNHAYAAGRVLTPEETIAEARAIAAEMSDVAEGQTYIR
jgi:predicted ATPase/transcriptional regulator with XRE-family HTH domain